MKKILFIFMFLSQYAIGQITISSIYNYSGCSAGLSSGIPLVQPLTANKLYIASFWATHVWNEPTISSSNGLTWVFIGRVGNSTGAIHLYRLMPTSNYGSETVTATYSGGIADSYGTLWEISNVQTGGNGSNAIKQVIYDSANAADPVITFGSMGQRNAAMTFLCNNANPFSGSAESGWSEIVDVGCATYTSGYYVMDRINTDDNTAGITASSSNWKGIGLLFRQSGTHSTLINSP